MGMISWRGALDPAPKNLLGGMESLFDPYVKGILPDAE